MLEILINLRSFVTMVGHLNCCQATLPTFLKGLSLPSMVQTTPIFLGCWALIAPPLVFHL